MTDEGRAKALLYTSNLPSTIERQCLAQAPSGPQYRPLGMRIWADEVDKDDTRRRVGRSKAATTCATRSRSGWTAVRSRRPTRCRRAAGFSTGRWKATR